MEIEDNARVKNTKSSLWQMITCAIEGVYAEQYQTDEGKELLFRAYKDELDLIANTAFNKGREYEANKGRKPI